MKKIYFVAGLPRSGSTLIINVLKQNPNIYGAAVSSLCTIVDAIYTGWDNIQANKEYPNDEAKKRVIKAAIENYHGTDKNFIFDKDTMWINKISLLEDIFQKEVKILCPVRNPAEILSSYEKMKRNHPLKCIIPENGKTTIASRCFHYAGPDGVLGTAHALHKDAIVGGNLDKLLFVDYNNFCSTPKMQLKRIYDFFELPKFTHDINNIEQTEKYNDIVTGYVDPHKVRPQLEKQTTNCIEYLGLDLYEQYNKQIFWDAWI
jgi:sulfotransferase